MPHNSVLVWGRHAVESALKNDERRFVKIYAAPDMMDDLQEMGAGERNIAVEVMDKAAMGDAIARHLPQDEKAVHQGIVAVMRPLEPPSLEDWLHNLDDDRVVVMVLDRDHRWAEYWRDDAISTRVSGARHYYHRKGIARLKADDVKDSVRRGRTYSADPRG